MKNQYFGDINDYKKYGLLRSIMSASDISILISWMLTEDDGSTDGKFIEYLSEPEKWSQYDSQLYSEIVALISQNEKREVSLIENSKILNGSQFFSKLVPDQGDARTNWLNELKNKSNDYDLVFLDPDNGLEIKSKKYGTKNSSKFLFWHEVESLWSSGKSLLIYQHFIREKRDTFIIRMTDSLSEKTKGSIVETFSTSNVLFLLALQPEHHEFHLPIINTVRENWQDQIKCTKTYN